MLNQLQIVLILVICVQSKHIQQTLRIHDVKSWKYITKFGGDLGDSHYTIKLSIKNGDLSTIPQDEGSSKTTIPIRFHLYLDDKWEEVLRTPECQRDQLTELQEQINLSSLGEVTTFVGSLNQKMRQHVWFFVLEDCGGLLTQTYSKRSTKARLFVDIHITNPDDSEFTTEENGIGTILFILSVFNFLFLVKTFFDIRKEYNTNEEWDTALLFLFSALALEAIHHVCGLMHTYQYAFDGMGLPVLSIIGDIMEISSAFIVTIILIMLSSGWSIEFLSILKFDILIPLSLVVGIGQMMIVGLGKLSDDHYTKYHKYEGWSGYAISLLYIGQFFYFIQNIITSRWQGESIKRFMIQLSIYGSLYLLSFPVFFVVSHFIAPYVRQKVIVYGTQFVRLFATALLLKMFTSKNNTYSQISYKNKAFLDRSKFE